MQLYSYTKEELEELADQIKSLILGNLVSKGLIDYDIAEQYTADNTVILREKSIFRTISDKWKKIEDNAKGYYMIVVDKHIYPIRDDSKDITDKYF